MTAVELRAFFGWCTLINWGFLMVWAIAFLVAHDTILKLHGGMFQLSRERFDTIHYGSMAVFKLGIVLFNLTPYIVLRIMA